MLNRLLSVQSILCAEERSTEFDQHRCDGTRQPIGHDAERRSRLLQNIRRRRFELSAPDGDGYEAALTESLQDVLANSDYGLADLKCAIDESAIHLYGIVKSYFALQMAIQLARGSMPERRIELDVDVVPRLYED